MLFLVANHSYCLSYINAILVANHSYCLSYEHVKLSDALLVFRQRYLVRQLSEYQNSIGSANLWFLTYSRYTLHSIVTDQLKSQSCRDIFTKNTKISKCAPVYFLQEGHSYCHTQHYYLNTGYFLCILFPTVRCWYEYVSHTHTHTVHLFYPLKNGAAT